MTVPFRWPWLPPPERPDPEMVRRAHESLVTWQVAAANLRLVLLEADDYVQREHQENPGDD